MSSIPNRHARTLTLFTALVVLAGLSTALPDTAFAGLEYDWANCATFPDGTGYCEGNFRGFRKDADPTVYARLFKGADGKRIFKARINHEEYSCEPEKPEVVASFDELMMHRDYFFIYWNEKGTCTSIDLYHGSAFSEY